MAAAQQVIDDGCADGTANGDSVVCRMELRSWGELGAERPVSWELGRSYT